MPYCHGAIIGTSARDRHDAETGRACGIDAVQARADEDILPLQSRRLQRGHSDFVIDAALAMGDQRHRPAEIESAVGATHPHYLFLPAMSAIRPRTHPKHN